MSGQCVTSWGSDGSGNQGRLPAWGDCGAGSQGGRALGTRPFPRGWLPGSRELSCYLLGRLPEPSSLTVFAQSPTLQKLKPAGRQAPPALMGSCRGLPSMGRSWRAGRSGVWSLGRASNVASLLPSSSSPRATPAPTPLLGSSSGSPGEARGQTSCGGLDPGVILARPLTTSE